jgi:hypothetical protein
MDLELDDKAKLSWKDFLRPGCLLGLAGIGIILFNVIRYWWSTPNVDMLGDGELASPAGSLKAMVWLVVGVGLTLGGALLSYIEFTRRP